jgi:hypothetical protein
VPTPYGLAACRGLRFVAELDSSSSFLDTALYRACGCLASGQHRSVKQTAQAKITDENSATTPHVAIASRNPPRPSNGAPIAGPTIPPRFPKLPKTVEIKLVADSSSCPVSSSRHRCQKHLRPSTDFALLAIGQHSIQGAPAFAPTSSIAGSNPANTSVAPKPSRTR